MSSPPDIDPYGVLGVTKDATIAEIRASHRKRVLKCHPDKIQDESQRNAAQDEFQKVQQAYELLSDETRRAKHDQRAKIAELKRELLERRRTDSSYGSPRGNGSSNREYRNGRIVEERVPMEVFFEEAMRFTEEPRSVSRKFDEFGSRPKPKSTPTDDKKKARTPMSTYHAAKEQRESAKAIHSDRAKTRDQERRRQSEAKFDAFDAYAESEDDASDSSDPRYNVYTKRTSTTPRRERESRSRPSESSRRHRERRYEEEGDLSDNWKTKIDTQYFHAEDYIANKGRASKSPRARHGYDLTEPESSGARPERRTRQRSSSRNPSFEDVGSPRTYESKPSKPAKMPTFTTSPGIKAPFRPFLGARAQTTSTGYVRPKRESRDSTLYNMAHEPMPSRPSRMRDRNDSGYSSPSTPEMLPRGASPKTSTRYRVTEEPDRVVVEPKLSSKYRSTRSPERERERPAPARATPKRSSTYQYQGESPRVETRSSRTSRVHPDIEYVTLEKPKYTRAFRYDDVQFAARKPYEEDYRPPHVDRRQSAY
jgi:curved DNA-binding protein CbpA